MSERDNLIQILRTRIWPKEGADPAEVVADLLLDNGVRFATVVRPGTRVYTTDGVRVYETTVKRMAALTKLLAISTPIGFVNGIPHTTIA